MRIIVAALLLALVPVFSGSGQAADLAPGVGAYQCDHTKPQYYGVYEPWSRREERPPRKGVFYHTQNPEPSVNFLIPMHGRLCVRPTPWTPAWFAYCEQKYPSFNPKTGTIRTPDGIRMCI